MNDLAEVVVSTTARTTNVRTNLIEVLCNKFGWSRRLFDRAVDRLESGVEAELEPEEESVIYTVEHREWVMSVIPDVIDCVVMAAFSTLAAAELWVANVRPDRGWYVIFKEQLDPPPASCSVGCKMMGIFDSVGCRIDNQPDRPRGNKMLCAECDEPSELYVLNDELWESLGYKRNHVVCMSCAAKKLKRKIRRSDLKKSLVQIGWINNFELLDPPDRQLLDDALRRFAERSRYRETELPDRLDDMRLIDRALEVMKRF